MTLPTLTMNRGSHRGRSLAAVSALALASALLIARVAVATEPVGPRPLEPPDRSSPRGTLHTLLESVDEAVELYWERDPAYLEPLVVAERSIDASRLAPRTAARAVREAVLQLKEVLDRIELPPESQIPDAIQVEELGLQSWTIPYTEIELVLLEEGDQAGQFVFSAGTVERLAEFYERVRHLPYRAGKKGAAYAELRAGTRSQLLGFVVSRLPAWAKKEVSGQLRWQWAGLVLFTIVGAGIAVGAMRLGVRYTKPVADSRGLNRLWAFVGPLTLIVVALWIRRASFEYLRIWGAAGVNYRAAMTVAAMFGGAWLTVIVVTRGAEHIIRGSRIERPLSQQLIRVSSRALALVLVVAWIFFGFQRLGVPLTAMVAGLGVGGLAVALAAQSTIENLIGGISLYADQPVRVGETMRLGDRVGVLEEVGLRSAKIRTRENTVITLPNAEFAKLQLENYSRKSKTLLRFTLRIRYETTRDQLRYLLRKLSTMLLDHPELEEDHTDAKLVGLGPDCLEIRLRANAPTTSWSRFKEIQQDVFLKALALVEESGTALAIPSAVQYAAADAGTDGARAREVDRQVAEWREHGEPPIPEFPAPKS